MEGKGIVATQEDAAGFCRKAEAAGRPTAALVPAPPVWAQSTAGTFRATTPHPQLTAPHQGSGAQITLTSKEAGLAYTGKQQRFQTEGWTHTSSQLERSASESTRRAPDV